MARGPSGAEPPPDWEYLLAHHFPDRYDRTFRLRVAGRSFHFCARCSGQLLGFVAILGPFLLAPRVGYLLSTPLAAVLLGLAPAVAMVDWLVQTVRSQESTNLRRVLSGGLLGAAFGGWVAYGVTWHAVLFAGGWVVLALYLALVCGVLYRTGAWRRVLAEHFPGVAPLAPDR